MLKPEIKKAIQAELLETSEIKASLEVVEAHLNAFEAVVVKALEAGEDVQLKGFVSFTTKAVEARTARNPQTGEEVQVDAHRKATASLAKGLRKFQ